MIADILHSLASQFQEAEHDYYPRPSLAGPERCIRQMVYWGMKVLRDPLPGRTLFVFDDSSWHEELTLNWLRQSAYQVHSEQMKIKIPTPVITTPPLGDLSGSVDGIVTDLLGVDQLLEHKGINHFTYMRYWNNDELPLDHITQCCLYLRGLHADNPDLREALLLIKNKNTSAYLEYLLEYEYSTDTGFVVNKVNSQGEKIDIKKPIEHITQQAFEKFALVQDYIEKKMLPLRQYDISHWRCEYCGYNKTCWKGWEEEIEAMSVVDMLPEEIVTMVRYRQELGGQKGNIDKEYKDLSSQIKKALKVQGMKEGRAGEYIARIRLEHREEKTSPAKTIEKLDIRKVKGG